MSTDRFDWQQVLLADFQKMTREPFFWLILIAPFLFGWGLRVFLPYLVERFPSVDLQSYFPLIVALFILTPPLYYGIVLALMVREEKDEGALLAVASGAVASGLTGLSA